MGKVTTKKIISELKSFKKKWKVSQMILFGSRARGEERLDSDVDVILVSGKFSGIPFRQRPDKFLDAWKLPVDFEVLCYTPEEIERKKAELGLVRQAFKEGLNI